MSDLKISITILVTYVIIVLGISNIERFEQGVLDFTPLFFVLIAVVIFSELILIGTLLRAGVKLRNYAVTGFWLAIYVLLWVLEVGQSASIQVHLVQILLVVLASILAYNVGRRIGEVDRTLEGLSSNAYPNRAREIHESRDLITAEITRSRRYHHPLTLLALRLVKPKGKESWKELESISADMFERFAIAKTSQILSDLTRTTDMVLLDRDGQFVIMCPESNQTDIVKLADRVKIAIEEKLNAQLDWGSAAFPDEAITFEDLLQTAQKRLTTKKGAS